MSHPGHAGPSFGQTEILYSIVIIPPPFLFEHDFDFGGGSEDGGGNLIAILKQSDNMSILKQIDSFLVDHSRVELFIRMAHLHKIAYHWLMQLMVSTI